MATNTIYVGQSIDNPVSVYDDDDLMSIDVDNSASIDNEELKIDRFTFQIYRDRNAEGDALADVNGIPFLDSMLCKFICYTEDGIQDINGNTLQDSTGVNLAVSGIYSDKMSLVDSAGDDLYDSDGNELVYIESVDERNYGTPIWYFRNNRLKGKYYVESLEHTSEYLYTFTCVSAIGILDSSTHVGGMYSNVTFADMLDEIIGNSIEYTCDDSIAGILVSGWLPYDTKRNNLHQLLFAHNVMVLKGDDGSVIFAPSYSYTPKRISADYIYTDGSVSFAESIKSVSVGEYSYIADSTVDSIDLFDSTNYDGTIQSVLVIFNSAPIASLATTGSLTIEESNVNYAVVSGLGKLTGKPYTVIKKTTSLYTSNTNGKEISSDGDTLINSGNSGYVANTLYKYYLRNETVKTSFVLGDERCGNWLKLTDVLGEESTGLIQSLSYSVSNTIKASCELISNYSNKNKQAKYNTVAVLAGNGTWDVPSTLTSKTIKAVLIGGGSGGNAGTTNAVGTGGTGGKVFTITIDTTDISTIDYSCGTGGNGGTPSSTSGENGTDTTFGEFTSGSGTSSNSGFVSVHNGTAYGTVGLAGLNGNDSTDTYHYGDGGAGGIENIEGRNGENGCVIIYYKEN